MCMTYAWKLLLQAVVSHKTWIQGTKLGSPGREAASTLSCKVTPSVPLITNKKQTKKKFKIRTMWEAKESENPRVKGMGSV